MKPSTFRRLMNFWPPFLGAGIKVKNISDDFSAIDVELKLNRFNRNYVGTHFGGSLFSMTDPFYMLILSQQLGKDYIIWDKEASIKFKKPGKGTLTAHFNVSKEQLKEIKDKADSSYKVEPVFNILVKDEAGDVVAEIDKKLYIRHKSNKPKAPKN